MSPFVWPPHFRLARWPWPKLVCSAMVLWIALLRAWAPAAGRQPETLRFQKSGPVLCSPEVLCDSPFGGLITSLSLPPLAIAPSHPIPVAAQQPEPPSPPQPLAADCWNLLAGT